MGEEVIRPIDEAAAKAIQSKAATNLFTMTAAGTQGRPFTVEAAMKTARGFHQAAGELEALHQQQTRGDLLGSVTIDQNYLDQLVGRIAATGVLEALALELALKARLRRLKIRVPNSHDHAKLYALLPEDERQKAEERWRCVRHPAMRATLAEALSFSADVFVKWRYMHEQGSVHASMGEMQRAFGIFADGL
jgi:hypothetical protein